MMKIADITHLKIDALLPSPKGVALALMEVCKREDVSTNEITRLIQTDPALSGRLICRANSVGQSRRPISSVSDAVTCVGYNTVKQLAMGFSLIDQYREGTCNNFDYQRYWSHSLLMAIAIQELGKSTQACAPNELFACGLMAQIGCLALATVYPTQYSALIGKESENTSLLALERKYLQTDHNDLTAAMLINFGIPRILVESVYYHETPARSSFSEDSREYKIVHLFYLAKQIADFGFAQEADRNKRISELIHLGGKISLDTQSFGSLIDHILKEWQSWGELLKIPATQLPSFNMMMKAAAPRTEDKNQASSLRVLLVEDDPSSRTLMENILSKTLQHTVFTASDGKQALSLLLEVMPHIVITERIMPVMDGLEFTQSLRNTEWGRNLYIIMLTSLEDEEEVIKAFDAGVDDYVTKPINIRAFRARLRAAWHYRTLQEALENDRVQLKQFAAELAISNRKLEHMALTDLLTGLPNRRAGLEKLSEVWSASERMDQLMAIMQVDIDHFKRINDTYGHAVGDKVLKEVAARFQEIARKNDTFFRMGGEEFMVICSFERSEKKSIVLFAERIRQQIAMLRITINSIDIRVSISIGVAVKTSRFSNTDQLIHAADVALYAAKNAGRNQVSIATEKTGLLTATSTLNPAISF